MQTIRVAVKPMARSSKLEAKSDGTWLARVISPPADGKANQELIGLVAAHFGVPKACVTIKAGAGSRFKTLRIDG